MDKIIYIHYGHDKFVEPDPIKNLICFSKPSGGLWASRKDGDFTWKEWCEAEEFHLDSFGTSFEFTVKENAKILELNNKEQLKYLPKIEGYGSRLKECWLDFEKLEKSYDAIELTNIGSLYWELYGWDCNSILIMNPKIVEII